MDAPLILGIDPGLAETGWGLISKEGSMSKHINHGCIKTDSKQPLELRLVKLYQELQSIVTEYKPSFASVEALFFAKNSSSAMAVAHARGVTYLVLAQAGLVVQEFTPNNIKQSVVGYGAADKAQVQMMVKVILGLKAIPKPDHAADALAAAICLAHTGVTHVQ